MKKIARIPAILLLMICLSTQVQAQSVNLTPWPKSLTTKSGQFVLPQTITMDVSGLSDEVVTEANNFADALRAATGRSVTMGSQENAAITLKMNGSTLADEGYILQVAAEGITLRASTAKGFFYGLQSIKKMLPANVLLEKLDANATYALPFLTINDAPRFAYRGFMLDVSRHFFTVDEIKKMLRIMAYYKMNHFHWHLTDDQGWRVEVKKYPKLTTVGATRANSFNTDLKYGQYWTNEPYGPYFYTLAAGDGIWMPVFEGTTDYWKPLSQDASSPDYYVAANPGAKLPRIYGNVGNGGYNRNTNTKMLQSAAYMRVKNITLSYTFPKNLLQKVFISNLRAYVSAENPFTFTSLPDGVDPETLSWSYPMYRTISFGLNITL